MKYIERHLSLELPEKQSTFLWGPRKTGESTYLQRAFPGSLVYDFLQTDLVKLRYSTFPEGITVS